MNETPSIPVNPENGKAEEIPPAEGKPLRPPDLVRVKIPFRIKRPWVTYGLLSVTTMFFILQQINSALLGTDLLLLWGAKINESIYAGQVWRFLTPMFLHGSFLHIAFNMYALFIIGSGLELYYGHKRFLLLYLAGGFSGNVLSFLLTSAPSLGASTAIFGLVAAQGIFIYKNRFLFGKRSTSLLINTGMIVVFNLVLGMTPGIDNWGHLGGLIGGAAFAWYSGPLLTIIQTADGLTMTNQRPDNRAWQSIIAIGLVWAMVIGVAWFLHYL